ncbi:26549_t:CDS:2 [Gigaspora margarita]|uniref:26549_t:CDS:1 n=1 Tax=Gigaspora margarita TaxID=4874 RepID=A0ABN7UY30_GIGMA|nr:26549_t:CDS:2 [Gigaspora margarita]
MYSEDIMNPENIIDSEDIMNTKDIIEPHDNIMQSIHIVIKYLEHIMKQ